MSVSIMITLDDSQKIKNTLDCLNFLSNISQKSSIINFNDSDITSESINSLISYYTEIYALLTTSGMTLQQYEDSISS